MKDNKQNLTDLIGALAVDIEEIKKKLEAKDEILPFSSLNKFGIDRVREKLNEMF